MKPVKSVEFSSTPKILVLFLSMLWHTPLWAENTTPTQSVQMDTITVKAHRNRDKSGYTQVYSRDISNMYKGKQEIETYRGSSVADLIGGMAGVYSGDARNSGALDPNIRGIQGEGKVPVTVDGTEQAISVWRGFEGISNRNYIDPNLVSSVYVEKGASANRDIRTGIGGSVSMKTLEIDDIVPKDQKFGMEVKMETGNNTIKQREYAHAETWGTDYRRYPKPYSFDRMEWAIMLDDSDRQKQRFGGRGKLFKDNAFRISAGMRGEVFDGLIAYAWRDKGNYFAGSKGAERYGYLPNASSMTEEEFTKKVTDIQEYTANVGTYYHPSGEVANTSLNMRSWLGKGTFKLPDNQKIQLGIRHTNTRFGEIMPYSILFGNIGGSKLKSDGSAQTDMSRLTKGTLMAEWPQAWVKQTAVNLDYSWNPENSRWVDLKAGIWGTFNNSQTNSTGGYPASTLFLDKAFNDKYAEDWYYKGKEPEWDKLPPNTNNRFTVFNAAAYRAKNNRLGINLSNRMKLADTLELTLTGDYQREKLKGSSDTSWILALPHDEYRKLVWDDPETTLNSNFAMTMPRQGKRNEWNVGFNFKYEPTPWLTLNAGGRYTDYRMTDTFVRDYLSKHLDRLEAEGEFNVLSENSRNVAAIGSRLATLEEYRARMDLKARYEAALKAYEESPEVVRTQAAWDAYDQKFWAWINTLPVPDYAWALENMPEETERRKSGYPDFIPWPQELTDLSEEYNNSTTLPANIEQGYMPLTECTTDPAAGNCIYWKNGENPVSDGRLKQFAEKGINQATGEVENKYQGGALIGAKSPVAEYRHLTEEELRNSWKKSGHAFAPMFSATVKLGDHTRLFARYTEFKRFPSMYEGTFGFGNHSIAKLFSIPFDRTRYPLKPEHAKNWEISLSHDFTRLLPKMRYADVRLTYFHNKTRNVIDRNYTTWQISNYDKQVISGLELQTRFDNGRVFGDLGVVRNMKNEVCDRRAIEQQYDVDQYVSHGRTFPVPYCQNGGFASGWLINRIQPRWSVVANLGGRFLNEKLEIGSRLTFHSRVEDKQQPSARWREYYLQRDGANSKAFNSDNGNANWQPVTVVDAYVRYKFNKHFSAELTGSNLTDRYYLDPMSRSYMPAPGRTLRIGLTGKW